MQIPSTEILTFLDTGKKRHVLRAKQAAVSKILKEVIDEYCQFFGDNDPAKILLACEQGTFSLCRGGVTGNENIGVGVSKNYKAL